MVAWSPPLPTIGTWQQFWASTPTRFLVMFALSAFAAGIGGALLAPLNALTPEIASTYVIEAFAVVVVGGIGSVMDLHRVSCSRRTAVVLVILAPSTAEVSIVCCNGGDDAAASPRPVWQMKTLQKSTVRDYRHFAFAVISIAALLLPFVATEHSCFFPETVLLQAVFALSVTYSLGIRESAHIFRVRTGSVLRRGAYAGRRDVPARICRSDVLGGSDGVGAAASAIVAAIAACADVFRRDDADARGSAGRSSIVNRSDFMGERMALRCFSTIGFRLTSISYWYTQRWP